MTYHHGGSPNFRNARVSMYEILVCTIFEEIKFKNHYITTLNRKYE